MSTFDVNFSVQLLVGEQIVPLASEFVVNTQAAGGVSLGFIFKLDRPPASAPVSIYLGDLIAFIENKMNGGDLSTNPGVKLLSDSFSAQTQPGVTPITAANFNSGNQLVLNIYEFSINSSKEEFLFQFSMDVTGSDPTKGYIPLPPELASWLKIDNLSISFSATKKKSSTQPVN